MIRPSIPRAFSFELNFPLLTPLFKRFQKLRKTGGIVRLAVQVPHFPSGSDFQLPVPVKDPWPLLLRQSLSGGRTRNSLGPDEVHHREGGCALHAPERHAEDRAQMILELARPRGILRVVAGVVHPRSDLVDEELPFLVFEELDGKGAMEVDSAREPGACVLRLLLEVRRPTDGRGRALNRATDAARLHRNDEGIMRELPFRREDRDHRELAAKCDLFLGEDWNSRALGFRDKCFLVAGALALPGRARATRDEDALAVVPHARPLEN